MGWCSHRQKNFEHSVPKQRDLLMIALVDPRFPIGIEVVERPALPLVDQRLQLMGELLVHSTEQTFYFALLMESFA